MNQNQIKGKLLSLNMKKEEANDKVNRATKIIFWVAGLNFLFAVFNFLTTNSIIVLVVAGIISLILAGLGFWSKKSPLIALIISLSILTVLFTLDFISSTQLGLLAISGRVAVLLILSVGIYNVIWANKIIKEYNELAAAVES